MLRTLFKKRDLAALLEDAETLFAESQFGDAKLAYDRVAERARKEGHPLEREAEARSAECCDKIALRRLAEARRLHPTQPDLAHEELQHALETARSEGVRELLRAAERELTADLREKVAEAPVALSPEEQLMLLTSAWEPRQAEELEALGEPLFTALLALETGEAERALSLLATLLDESRARYLWLELGRAQFAAGELAAAEKSLRTFLQRLEPSEGVDTRLSAHRELARLAHQRGDPERAVAELEACAEALPDDPRPLFELGNYLRLVGRPREAIEVLELCVALFEQREVEWPVQMELGLACAAAGEQTRAIELLEQLIRTLLAKGHLDLPPPAGVALAKLHEQQGNLVRAADLYRTLATGTEDEQRGECLREAARLLTLLNLPSEAARLLEQLPSESPLVR